MAFPIPAGSAPAAAAATATAATGAAATAIPAFNPPSLNVNEYTASVWRRIDLKPGKYYVMSLYDSPSPGSIVKVTKVTPFPPGTPYVSHGNAKVEVQEDSGTILPQTTTMPFKFFEYRIPPKNIPIPNENEPSEPLFNNNAIRVRQAAHREYKLSKSVKPSKAQFYSRRGRRQRQRQHQHQRSRRNTRRQRQRSSRRSH